MLDTWGRAELKEGLKWHTPLHLQASPILQTLSLTFLFFFVFGDITFGFEQ